MTCPTSHIREGLRRAGRADLDPGVRLVFLHRLQNSYTASQRTNQELEDKLHTLVISPGRGVGRGMGALWLALCSQHSRGLGLAWGVPLCPGAWEGGGTVAGKGPQCVLCESGLS